MNLGAMIALLKLAQDSGFVSKTITPPTSKAGVRPSCGLGEKAVFFQNPDRYECVPEFK
jgi:hypothetical protein